MAAQSWQYEFMDLNERSQLLFKNLMSLYLNDGKPVGSTTLAKLPEVAVSSSTIRNVLADLERMGLIRAPHTSAGRIPTDYGFRVFVDSILTIQPINQLELNQIELGFEDAQTQDEIIGTASNLLSDMTNMASLIMLPNRDHEVLRHIDFVQLGAKRVLVVLVLNDQDIQNRIIELDEEVGTLELVEVANYLNQNFAGRTLTEAKHLLVERMDAIRHNMNNLMASVVEATDKVIDQKMKNAAPYFVSGQTNLLNYEELADAEKLRALFQSFEHHNDLLRVFDKTLNSNGVQIFIGNECGDESYRDCSIVATPYEVDGEIMGVLGVVGPSRMPYDKIVPKVDMTAKILSSLLKKNF